MGRHRYEQPEVGDERVVTRFILCYCLPVSPAKKTHMLWEWRWLETARILEEYRSNILDECKWEPVCWAE